MNTKQTQKPREYQPCEVARALRNRGLTFTAQDVAAKAKALGFGRVLRRPNLGYVLTAAEAAKVMAAMESCE